MWSYTLLFTLQILTMTATVCAERSVRAELHQRATLTCHRNCSAPLEWRKLRKTVARCDRSSCSSEEGFNISHDQYLQGNPHLTITAAQYRTRGSYTCQCDGKDICDVRLYIQTVELTRNITPGEPIDVLLPVTDPVEVSFTASDAAHPSDLPVCTVDNEKIQCSPDYSERASRTNTLQIKGGNVSDSGIYTVRDIINDETLAIVRVAVRGKIGTPTPKTGEQAFSGWVIGIIFLGGLVLGIILHPFVCPKILRCWNWGKNKALKRSENDHSPSEWTEVPLKRSS